MAPHHYSILTGGIVTTAFEEYAYLRAQELTAVCTSTSSTLEEIRVAQAGIAEMNLIIGLRTRLKMEQESTNEPA